MSKHNIVHVEIPTINPEQSGKFYQGLFGWKITPVPETNYTLFEPEAGPGGGFTLVGENTQAGELLIYVDSDDIEADLQKAESLGAKVLVPKSEIQETGWFGVFTDPSGNMIALYTDLNPAPMQ
jgi:uncharacterized protein